MLRKVLFSMFMIVVLVLGTFGTVFADDGVVLPVPDASGLAVAEDDVLVAPELKEATGPVQIVVRLVDAPLAVAVGEDAKHQGSKMTHIQQRDHEKKLNQKQNTLLGQIAKLGGRELGRVSIVLNAVIVEVDASKIDAIAALSNVAAVNPLGKYEKDLSETVPYIGAAAVQTAGVDGTGVRVAVLDSGIDYTHYNLGGSGDVADFDGNDPTIIEPGTFPTAKVVGGYDFVGEAWPNSAEAPDPDPLDKGTGAGHGSHVADIIAGLSNDGLHKGVAPGASLYAVGVCSKVSTACSGVALLQGMDYALDPNGDGDISDAVDVINMSLGSSYGQRQDDLSFAAANAVRMGVVVVASAGNAADRPYIVGSPSSQPEVISVAQTQVPSAVTFALAINSPANIAGAYKNTETFTWAPIGAGFTGDVVYVGRGCNSDTYLADPNGKVALIDRGVCNISEKVRRASDAGATGVLIGLVAAGDAVTFSNGGQCPEPADGTCKPSLVIIKSYADLIKANIAAPVNVSVSPANVTALMGSMVGSSSRGPSFSFSDIKPDIGAPGASLSAEYGTGTGETAFGGTSGAAPMVSGAAALVIQKYPKITPKEVKSRLMNTAETEIYINPATQPGVVAPITRIGGGEVRVDKAINAKTVAWDAEQKTGSLSFGYATLTGTQIFEKMVVVRNYSKKDRTYKINADFRYADDAASGAVKIITPSTIKVKGNSLAFFIVKLKVDANKLPVWDLNGGMYGGDGYRLQNVEFDGYINISDATDNVHLAWQILPHRAANVTPTSTKVKLNNGVASLKLRNIMSALDGNVDAFSLLGTSDRIQRNLLPQDGDNFAVVDLRYFGARMVDIGGGEYGIQFAINTFGARAHPNYPAEFDVYLDTDLDGFDDFVIYNLENGGFGATGQNVVRVINLNSGANGIFFYSDADLNSGNIIMTAPMSFLSITPSTQFKVSVYAFDNYFTGNLTDAIEGMTYTAGMPRYYPNSYSLVVPKGGNTTLNISALPGGETTSPSQTGLLLLYWDANQKHEADAIVVKP